LDPEFSETLTDAYNKGVEVVAYSLKIFIRMIF
jgi:DNA-binding sugar fermentation-stimulating protein